MKDELAGSIHLDHGDAGEIEAQTARILSGRHHEVIRERRAVVGRFAGAPGTGDNGEDHGEGGGERDRAAEVRLQNVLHPVMRKTRAGMVIARPVLEFPSF